MVSLIVAVAIWLFAASFEVQAQTPVLTPGGVVNSASYAAVPLAPGSLATAFGTFSIAAPVSAATLPLQTSLSGLSIVFGSNQQAPLYYVSSGSVNFQVPWELAGLSQVSVVATANGALSAPQ